MKADCWKYIVHDFGKSDSPHRCYYKVKKQINMNNK